MKVAVFLTFIFMSCQNDFVFNCLTKAEERQNLLLNSDADHYIFFCHLFRKLWCTSYTILSHKIVPNSICVHCTIVSSKTQRVTNNHAVQCTAPRITANTVFVTLYVFACTAEIFLILATSDKVCYPFSFNARTFYEAEHTYYLLIVALPT